VCHSWDITGTSGLALTACRLAWSIRLGGRRGLLELSGRNPDTRFGTVFDEQKVSPSQVLMGKRTGLLVLNYPDTYIFKSWHGTLLTMAILCLSVTFNTFFAQKLHLVVSISQARPDTYDPMLTHILGNRRIGPARSRLLLHSHSTLGTIRKSSVTRSVDGLL
jgi:hypothetical protein